MTFGSNFKDGKALSVKNSKEIRENNNDKLGRKLWKRYQKVGGSNGF